MSRTPSNMIPLGTKAPKFTLYDSIKQGAILGRTRTTKPLLPTENKFERMKFTLSFIRKVPNENRFIFDNMHNMVHIDEKWFYLKTDSRRVYLRPDEDKPEVFRKENISFQRKCILN